MKESYHDSIYRMYLLGFSVSASYAWKHKGTASTELELLAAYALGKRDSTVTEAGILLRSRTEVVRMVETMLGAGHGRA